MKAPTESRPSTIIEDRLERGVALLFELEQRGETDPEYHRWLNGWLSLLQQYETDVHTGELRAA
jgi:hypothetical protein